ncbi:MAG: PD-(D/E)XK nuclease family protein, partial [Tannerellaceae bacterium]
TPFTYIQSEKLIQTHFALSDVTRVRMKGFIDRVDEVNKQVRIIDYKTGKAEKTFKEIADLFDSELKDRPKAIMQVFTYALLTMDEFRGRDLAPGIYTVRQIFTDAFDPAIYHQTAPKIKHQVDSFAPYAKEFEEKLRSCLDDIFNPDINFNQTLNEKNCEYCPFKTVCNK